MQMPIRHALLHAGPLVGILAALAAPAHAQQLAGTLDQLRVLVKVGDTVTVTDNASRRARGRVIGLSSAALELAVDGQARTFTDNDLAFIHQRRGDSLKNGTLIGLGIGLGIGLAGLAAAASDDALDEFGGAAGGTAIVAFYAGIGAAAGVGIDAAIRGRQLIYVRPGAPPPRVAVGPLLGRGRTGLRASFSF